MIRKAPEYRYMVKAPQKAPNESITDDKLDQLPLPMIGSPKHDGYRALVGDRVYTSVLKLHRNKDVQLKLTKTEYYGLDGELMLGVPYSTDPEDDVYNRTTALSRAKGEFDFKLYVFDNWMYPEKTYLERWINTHEQFKDLPYIEVVEMELLETTNDIILYTNNCLDRGYEGAMVRSMLKKYKEGRCTFREMNIFKRKPYIDTEAVILDVFPQMKNLNPQTTNELGKNVRSSHKDNKVAMDTLGSFLMQAKEWEKPFHCGIGTMKKDRAKELWAVKETLKGKIAVIKYQEVGSIDAPRQPVFKGFRDKNDTNFKI